MNPSRLERLIFLEQSGELSSRRLRRLERALAVSEEGRRLREDLVRLNRSLTEPDTDLPPCTVSAIDARLRGRGRRTEFSIRKPSLALAACLTVALGLWRFQGEKSPASSSNGVLASATTDVWQDPLEEDLSRLENLITALSGESFDIMEM